MRHQSNTFNFRPEAAAIALGAALLASPLVSVRAADINLPPVSVGAGVRTSFSSTDFDASDETIDDFALNSARIYISGKATDYLSLMFNTEYNSDDEEIRVIDAVAQFSFSDKFNVWAGRFLPPSDRANLYGPYYASHWGVYRDGVQDGYPFETEGRADGLMYWGQFGIAKVSVGAFDIANAIDEPTTGSSDVLWAGRVQLDFWDAEAGYYLNGTYYGAKDLLAVGFAGQTASGDNAYTVDFLMEKKVGNGGAFTIEAQYGVYDGLGGYPSPNGFAYEKEDGYYVLGAYLFAPVVGIGKFQALAKYGKATYEYDAFDDVDQKTLELNVNYIIKDFNARISLFYIDQSFDPDTGGDYSQIGLGLQVQI
ncbi:MAG TPA: hypothetical protein PKE27_22625 [Povalibacter sp.]|uniref:hypothetical protein n=1 Tax=Povalibacter sp. TaxID=1962978 RepID=UPI002BAAE77D|nr:hypothetical protein [Povalibacter sp.]HMN47388.1 hypothetical protein [Povalibacter sp.]